MVKAYQRYSLVPERKGTLGVIVSTSCSDIAWADASGNLVLAPALDSLNIWNLRTGGLMAILRPENARSEVTAMTCSPDQSLIASGYFDGTVRIWDRKTLSLRVTLEGHKSGVNALAFNSDGTMLASGSMDTDIIVWDVIGEAGKYRLRGHKDGVTCLAFLTLAGLQALISASKDGLIKLWDLSQQHCIQTLTGHRAEVWCLSVNLSRGRLVTAGADAEIRVWTILDASSSGESIEKDFQYFQYSGCITKSSQARALNLQFFAKDGEFLLCQTADKKVEVYRLRSLQEATKKMRRRLKRAKERASSQNEKGSDDEEKRAEVAPDAATPSAVDELERISIVGATSKIRAVSVVLSEEKGKETPSAKLVCALVNNSMEVYKVALEKGAEAAKVGGLHVPGHHSDVRALAFASDDTMLASCAGGEVKIWNASSGACVHSMESGYGLCLAFAPGDKYVMVGTKAGRLQVFNIASSEMVEDLEAHQGCLWSLSLRPDGKGIITAGADKRVKFWDFSAARRREEEGGGGGEATLGLVESKEMTMEDDILSVAYSANGKMLALALLDSTVKIFWADSLRFFLSLYGHRLPVLCLDMSSDSSLMVTGSADKNVKIWGLDFGDCHKSLFAHGDSVMAVRFVPRTHYFCSAGKDRLIKMWDADKMVLVTTMRAHYAEIWCLAVSRSGDVLASGAHDRAVRVWERTGEQVFIEEERAKDRDEALAAEYAREDEALPQAHLETLATDESAPAAARQSGEALDAADRILDALALCANPPGSADSKGGYTLLLGLTPNGYFRHVMKQVRANDLEPALLSLPFEAVLQILTRLAAVLDETAAAGGTAQLEALCKAVGVLVKVHHARLAVTPAAAPLLRTLRAASKESLTRRADLMGYNLAALRCLRRRLPKPDEQGLPPSA